MPSDLRQGSPSGVPPGRFAKKAARKDNTLDVQEVIRVLLCATRNKQQFLRLQPLYNGRSSHSCVCRS
jgi:hypothetical protein